MWHTINTVCKQFQVNDLQFFFFNHYFAGCDSLNLCYYKCVLERFTIVILDLYYFTSQQFEKKFPIFCLSEVYFCTLSLITTIYINSQLP